VEKLYKEYFQKSKVFLYPLLGIKKGVRFVPTQTYLSWGNKYDIDSNKLLCLYITDKDNKNEFTLFSDKKLKTLPVFEKEYNIDEFNFLYVFDLTLPLKKRDIKKFKEGQYSKLTKKTKESIIKFFGERGKIAEYIESYLYPAYYYEDYSELLNVNIKDLETVGQLCSKPDLQKEDFSSDCELIKKSLYLKIKN
jgi:hypothetical protein